MRTVKREYNQKFGGKTKKFNFKNVNEHEYDIIKIKKGGNNKEKKAL